MAVVRKNNLKRFNKRLLKYRDRFNLEDIVEAVGEIGVDIANSKYNADSVQVYSERTQNGVKIVARGDKIAYKEFGTGVVGKNTYEGTLPTQKLVFESPVGVTQSTEGWQYNYRKEQGQTDADWTGFVAEAQMFKTGRELREELPKQIKQKIRGDK